jgi:hypothetical protein
MKNWALGTTFNHFAVSVFLSQNGVLFLIFLVDYSVHLLWVNQHNRKFSDFLHSLMFSDTGWLILTWGWLLFLRCCVSMAQCLLTERVLNCDSSKASSSRTPLHKKLGEILFINGTVSWDCRPSVFFIKQYPWAPDSRAKAFWNSASNSQRYDRFSKAKIVHAVSMTPYARIFFFC